MNAPSWCADAWSAMQIMRKLGFSADDLFIEIVNAVGIGLAVAVVLRTGGKEFVWTVTKLAEDGPVASLQDHWPDFVRSMNSASNSERMNIFFASETMRNFPGYIALARTITEKGITIPKLGDLGALSDALVPTGASQA